MKTASMVPRGCRHFLFANVIEQTIKSKTLSAVIITIKHFQRHEGFVVLTLLLSV